MNSMDRPAFIRALVGRLLTRDGFDPQSADILEAGLRSNRDGYELSPDDQQRPATRYPGLNARPWHDNQTFSWIAGLEAASPSIQEECFSLHKAGAFRTDPSSVPLTTGTWQQIPLFAEGRRFSDYCALCPETTKAIERIPGATTAGLVYFSMVGPSSSVLPHCGPHNARLRCHLGLKVPHGCRIRVGTQVGQWVEGKAIIFDDSFEHELWNDVDSERIVLIIDVWHPDLTPGQIAAIKHSRSPAVEEAFDVAKELWRSKDAAMSK